MVTAQNNDRNELPRKVDSLLKSNYRQSHPGVTLAIIQNGNIIYSNQIGQANLEYEIPISDSTSFHIASVSKQFTAFLAVSLENEGKLAMNDDIKKYLPELKYLPYKISLRQLANHTHGLPNLFELAQLKGIGIGDIMTHKEVVNMLLKIKAINFRPGEKYEYNNTGFVLLAEIIERVSGKPFQEILKNKVFKPLDMNHSLAVNNSRIIIKNKAHSYKINGEKYENYDFNIMANGSSGISTTINDLSKWAINFLVPSDKSYEVFQEMQNRTILNNGQIIQYGLGLEFKKYKGLDLVFHGGGDAAFRSYILHIPKYRFSVVILGNSNDFVPLTIVYQIVDLYLKKFEVLPVARTKVKYSTAELKVFEGTYKMFPGNYLNILAEKDKLYLQSYGSNDKAELPIIGDGEFLFPYIPTAKISFYKNGFYFNIADFKYDCKQVKLNPPKPNEVNLLKFTGLYRNEELNTEYQIIIKNNQLMSIHSFNKDILLIPLSENRFYSNQSFFGELEFVKNSYGKVIEFKLSGQNLKNIEFIKIK